MKMTVDQAFRKARASAANGNAAEAERLLRDVLERFPGNKTAKAELEALLAPRIENPPQETMNSLVALYSQGHWQQGADLAETLIQRFPHGEVLHNIAGALCARLARYEKALALYDTALALAPDYFEAWNNRGNALRELGRMDEALASFDKAVAFNPAYAEAHMNRGIAATKLMRLDEALTSFDRAIALNPDLGQIYNNKGNAMLAMNRAGEALQLYDKAIALNPSYAEAFVGRGNALKAMMRWEDAVASYDSAIALSPTLGAAFRNRGTALRCLKRLDEALASCRKAQQLDSDSALARADVRNLEAHLCIWNDEGGVPGMPSDLVDASDEPIEPFHLLRFEDDPKQQLDNARLHARHRWGSIVPTLIDRRSSSDRIKIGYFSADFHNHATMYLMARLFELHDKSRFEVHAFSFGMDVHDEMRTRLKAAVDHFHQVDHLNDREIAGLARDAGIDIAMDLKGYTGDCRAGIFAWRAAPVQVSYLGFPGTMGADFIDYIIADDVTVPPQFQPFYSEKVAYLPNCYQVNDDRRAISDRIFTRTELGLPEDGLVFCSFNNNYKITPAEFDIWMRLLAKIEGSVLWLLQDNEWAAANLRREATARGIDPARLIFAERAPNAEHLARQRCADLFLDTFKINAHTTASDALWAGLPVITKLGKSFVARVAGSLLHTIGLPELVTETDEAYEALALELATDPAKLAAIRDKLAANRLTTPLFDTERYARDFERLLEDMIAANPR